MTELHCYAADSGALRWRAVERLAVHDRLADINVRYAHVELPDAGLDALADQGEVIEAFRQPLDELMLRDGFNNLEVAAVQCGQPDQVGLHRQLMSAHAH